MIAEPFCMVCGVLPCTCSPPHRLLTRQTKETTMDISKLSTPEFIDWLKEHDYEPEAYSGRGMFGAYCVSVHLRQYEYGGDLPDGSRDSMGLGSVVYWRNHKWPDQGETQ